MLAGGSAAPARGGSGCSESGVFDGDGWGGSGGEGGSYGLDGSLVVGIEGAGEEVSSVGLQVSAGGDSSWWAMSDESMGV